MSRSFFTLAIILLSTACSGEQTSDMDITRPDFDQIPVFDVEEHFTVSTFGEDAFFGSISQVVTGYDQTIFVSDSRARKIYMFDQQGACLGYLGGEGEGPGEFRYIGSVSMLAPDTLQVYDRELARITFYSKQDDRWAPVKYLDRPAGSREYGADMFFTFNSLYPHSGGYLARFTSSFTPVDTTTHTFAYYTLHDYDMNRVDDREYLMHMISNPITNRVAGRSVSVMSVPEGHRMLFAIIPDARKISTWTGGNRITNRYITREDSSGFVFPSRRISVTEEEKTALAERFIPDPENAMISREQLKEHIPEYKGFSRQLIADDQNRIWVLTWPFEEDDPEWLIYSMEGELLAAAPHPGGTLMQVKDSRMYVSFTSTGEEPAFGVFNVLE